MSRLRPVFDKVLKYVLVLAMILGQVLGFPLFASIASAAVKLPDTLSYQGRLLNAAGTAPAADGSHSIIFKIYDALAGGTLMWSETDSVTTSNGYFTTLLGNGIPFESSGFATTFDFTKEGFLTLAVDGDADMSPRMTMSATAYARTARGVEALATEPTGADNTRPGQVYYNTSDGRMYVYDAIEGSFVRIAREEAPDNVTNALNFREGSNNYLNLDTTDGSEALTFGNPTTNPDISLLGNVQVGVGGAGSTAPNIFALDVKSDAGDPTGFNGATYYNANSNKFRCFVNGSWNDCDTTGGTASLQTAYNNGATITTAGSTDFALTLTSGNFTAIGAGSVNLTPTGASSFTSGGALTLDAGAALHLGDATATSISLGRVGFTTAVNGDFSAAGNFITPNGPNYTTIGVQNDVNLGTGAVFNYTGAGAATFTGITGGVNGRSIRIINNSAFVLTIAHNNAGSIAANRILTANGLDNTVPANAVVSLQYDVTSLRWHVVALPVSSNAIFNGGNAFGSTISIGSTDAQTVNLITSGATALSLNTAGNGTLTGDLTVNGSDVLSPAATALRVTTGTTGALTLDSGTTGAVNLGTGASAKTITIGNTTGATAVNINAGSGGIALAGNTTISGTNTFTTGTGTTTINSTTITLAGSSTVLNMTGTGTLGLNTTTNRAITTGTGLFTTGGSATVNGDFAAAGNVANLAGADYPTTGVQNDVNLGAGAFFRYTGASTATFTGLAGGTNGRILRIINTSASNLIISNQGAGSLAANRIITGQGADLTVLPDVSVAFQYDATALRWHLVSFPFNPATLSGTTWLQGGNAYAATGTLGTTDFFGLNLITNGATALALDTSGNANLTGALTITGGSIVTPAASVLNVTTGTTGALTLDSGTTGAVNLGTGASAKTITVGNITGATTLNLKAGSGGIVLTGNTSVAGSNSLTVGTGTFTASGNIATPKGTDYATTGVQNDVNLGTGSLFRYTGAGTATFTGLAGGTDGRQLHLVNASSFVLTLANQDSASTAANRIITTNGLSESVDLNEAVILQYDSGASRWRVIAVSESDQNLQQGGNAFGTTFTMGSTDANAVNIITNGTTALSLSTAGNATLTGDLTVTGGDILSPAATALNITSGTTGALTLDSGTTGAVNLGAGANAKTITIGNATGATAVNINSGTGNVNLQSAGTSTTGRIQIGSGAGSSTPDLLALDVKNNSAADPSGVNGDSYYNSVSNKFRCFEGGGWKDCDTTGGTTTLQTAYNSGATITTSGSTDIALILTSGNFTASGAGSVSLTPSAALTLTSGTAATWGTAAGNLNIQVAGTGTTANVQIGAGGAGSATPDLFVLDAKNDNATDPTGTDGASYYNAFIGKFRCYESGAWKDCDTGGGAGLTSLNGQSGSSQTLVTGTSGTDFNISSSADVHTFNLPDASTTARGVVTTGSQTFGGSKTFNNALLVNGNTTLGDAGADSVTVNGSTVTFAGNSTVLDMTGTGTLGLNTVTNRAITTGTGLFTAGGAFTATGDLTALGGTIVSGDLATPAGTDFSTTGTQNDVSFGTGSFFRYTGAGTATITGITGATNGRQIRIINVSAFNLSFTNQDSASTAANRIITGTASTLVVPSGAVVAFQYDSAVSRWRVVGLPASPALIGRFAFLNGGNAFGTTTSLGTTDAQALSIITNNTTALSIDTSGNAVLTGDFTVNGGDITTTSGAALTVSTDTSGALTLDSGTTGAVNLGTGANAKTITIGNTTSTTQVAVNAGSGNLVVTSPTSIFQTSTGTNDKLALTPSTGGGASFTGSLTSADLTVSNKTWTFPNLTGNVLLDTSTCPIAGTFGCTGGNSLGAAVSLGTTDVNVLNLITSGLTRFTVASGAATITGTGTTTVTSTGSMTLSSAAASALNISTGTTGALTLDSGSTGAVNLGNNANAKTITIGNTTGATTVNVNTGSGGLNVNGSTTITGANSFTTGTGTTTINSAAITLAGNSTVIDMTGTGTLGLNTTTNQPITTGTGLFTTGGSATVSGDFVATGNVSTLKGADYPTTGSQNDVNFGTGSLFSYTGAGTATFTGIAGGTNGRFIHIINNSASNITFTNEDTNSAAANRIITGSGGSIMIPPDLSIGLQYDSNVSRWRIAILPATPASISGYAFINGGNAFGATASLGTTDGNGLNFITGGGTRFSIAAGSSTLTGTGATTLTSTGALTLDAATSVSLGTGTATSVTIGKTGVTTTNTGSLTSTQTLTASNGLTQTTGALNLTATSGTLSLSGLSASSISTGANALTITSSNFNTTATGINSTAIGATTASTGAFTTLSSTGATNIATAGASNVTIATTGTGTVAIGNATGTFALTSAGGLNVTTGGALTGVASIDTIATSATALTFAGAGTISSTTTSAITLDSGSTGAVNVGTNANAKSITIGNVTGATSLNLKAGTGSILLSGQATGTSATFLGLPVKTDSGDPTTTQTNGAIYYNSSSNRFRCYENSVWTNCIGAALSSITAATTTNTIDSTNFSQTWNWSTLTTQTGMTLGGGTVMTTGSILALGGATYVHTTAETGSVAGITFTDASSNTTGNSITNGLNITSTVNTSGAGTKAINGVNIAAATLTGCSSGACTWDGLKVNTQATGAATTITQNGLDIAAAGIALGTLNGINISNITGGAGAETGIKIGSGWDTDITFGNTAATMQITTAGTLVTKNAAGSALLSLRDFNSNFGAALTSGAFIDLNSTFAEEFNRSRANNTVTAALARGDATEFSVSIVNVGGGGSGTAASQNVANGVERLTPVSGNALGRTGAVLEYLGTTAAGTANNIYLASNLPIITMKMKLDVAGANNRAFIGIGDAAAAVVTMPTNGIFFANCTASATCDANWYGVVNNAGTVTTVSCGAVDTANFAYGRIEVRSTTDVHFFMDTNVSNGIVETECGSGLTATPSVAMTTMIQAGSVTPVAAINTTNFDVDYIRTWQDDNVPSSSSTEVAQAPLQIEAGPTSSYDSHVALARLMSEEGNLDQSNLQLTSTDILEAGLAVVAPQVTAHKVDADEIAVKNLTVETIASAQIDDMNASLVALLESTTLQATDIASIHEALTSQATTIETVQVDLASLKAAFETAQASTATATNEPTTQTGLTVQGLATFAGGLRVDTITANAGTMIAMMSNITFFGTPYFNADMGGFAVIPAGATEVRVAFEKEYLVKPVVNASVSLDDAATGDVAAQAQLTQRERDVFAGDVRFIVTRKSTTGFTILLAKAADVDMTFSWIALAIKDAKTAIGDEPVAVPVEESAPTVSEPAPAPIEEPAPEAPAPVEEPVVIEEPAPEVTPIEPTPTEEPVVEAPVEAPVTETAPEVPVVEEPAPEVSVTESAPTEQPAPEAPVTTPEPTPAPEAPAPTI